jgi:hypothetical protein
VIFIPYNVALNIDYTLKVIMRRLCVTADNSYCWGLVYFLMSFLKILKEIGIEIMLKFLNNLFGFVNWIQVCSALFLFGCWLKLYKISCNMDIPISQVEILRTCYWNKKPELISLQLQHIVIAILCYGALFCLWKIISFLFIFLI